MDKIRWLWIQTSWESQAKNKNEEKKKKQKPQRKMFTFQLPTDADLVHEALFDNNNITFD